MSAAAKLASFVERLYAAPFDAFTETRKALAAELKAAGSKGDAAALLAMKKPTRTAWALNHVARHDPRALAAFLEATEALRAAQAAAIAKGTSAPLRDASRALNGAMATIVTLVKRALTEAGASLTVTQQRTVMRTLHAIPFAPPEEVDRLSRGTLVVDIDAPSDFGVFGDVPKSASSAPARDAHAARAREESRPEPHPEKSRDDRKARAKAAEAARAAKREAARAAAEAKAQAREAKRLEAIAERADEAATAAERDAGAASRHAADLASRARAARTKADTARGAAAKASAQLAHANRSAR